MSPPDPQQDAAAPLEDAPAPDTTASLDETAATEEGHDEKRMSLLEHLAELRVRLRNAVIAFLLAVVTSFFFIQRFFEVLTRPVRRGLDRADFETTLHVKAITEVIWVYMKLAIVAGVIIASPFVFWELWKFVAPGLYKNEKRLAGLVTAATALCFAAGAAFGYFVLSEPAAYYMFSLLKSSAMPADVAFTLEPVLMMEEVGNFLMLMLAGCGVAFELPIVIAILGWIGIVSWRGLWKFNKYAVVLSAVVGGILTPSPDILTQVLLAGPLYLLYNLSIVIVWLIERGRKRQLDELEKEYGEVDSTP